eukprot:12086400-Alexandrium_andersonii.AAC.1
MFRALLLGKCVHDVFQYFGNCAAVDWRVRSHRWTGAWQAPTACLVMHGQLLGNRVATELQMLRDVLA